MSAIETENGFTLEAREKLAIAAFARIAQYDDAIQQWFAAKDNETFPENVALRYQKKSKLRYGENPHQKAAFYVESPTIPDSLAGAEILHGKELSFNNILDLDSALNLVREFDQPAVSVIKHNNPCGAAFGENLPDVFEAAYNGDPLSAFGGILAFNREVGIETANRIASPNRFLECIIAPSYSDDALKILRGWKKNLRLLSCGEIQKIDSGFDYRRVHGGMLIQERDVSNEHDVELEVVTDRSPTEEELANLRFAWIVCKHVKSNAIVFAKEGAVVGVGAGQMSRVDSVQIAARKSDARSEGAVLASDAFFPFRDTLQDAAPGGHNAEMHTGG